MCRPNKPPQLAVSIPLRIYTAPDRHPPAEFHFESFPEDETSRVMEDRDRLRFRYRPPPPPEGCHDALKKNAARYRSINAHKSVLRSAACSSADSICPASRDLRFDYAESAQNGAAAGAGIAPGRTALIADDIASGRLFRLFKVSLSSEFGYYIVSPEKNIGHPKVRAFQDCLHSEASQI
jgi:DNA-binding transcriptional LysR family regulator